MVTRRPHLSRACCSSGRLRLALLAMLGLLAMHATPALLPGAGQMTIMSSERLAPSTTLTVGDTLGAETPASDVRIWLGQRRLPPKPGPHHMTQPCVSDYVRPLSRATPLGTDPGGALGHPFQAAEEVRVPTAPANGQAPGPDLTRLCISRT